MDLEDHYLSQTKKLSDHSFAKIFSRNPHHELEVLTYNCHLCSVSSLPGEKALQVHIVGKKHQHRLHSDYVPDATKFKAPITLKTKSKHQIWLSLWRFHLQILSNLVFATFYHSEAVPLGCENEINHVCYLEKNINIQKKPVIGLEYIVELIDSKMKEPFYICVLCDKKCDPRNIMPQLTSHRHRMKYLVRTNFKSWCQVWNKNRF